MIPLFVPPLVAGVAWGILGSPKTGLLNTALKWLEHRFPLQLLFDGGPDRRLRHLLRALRLHVHRLGAAATWTRAWRKPPRSRAPAPSRTLFTVTFPLIAPAILAGIAAVVRGHAGHLRRAGGARRAGQHQRAHHLHLQAHRLEPPLYNTAAAVAILLMVVTAILVWAQQRVLSGKQLRHRRRQGVPPAQRSISAAGAGSPSASAVDLPVRRGRAADPGADHRRLPQVPVLQGFRRAVRHAASTAACTSTACSTIRSPCCRSGTR